MGPTTCKTEWRSAQEDRESTGNSRLRQFSNFKLLYAPLNPLLVLPSAFIILHYSWFPIRLPNKCRAHGGGVRCIRCKALLNEVSLKSCSANSVLIDLKL